MLRGKNIEREGRNKAGRKEGRREGGTRKEMVGERRRRKGWSEKRLLMSRIKRVGTGQQEEIRGGRRGGKEKGGLADKGVAC